MTRTKYYKSREDSHDWLGQVKEDEHLARCNICNKVFECSNGGISDVRQHSKPAKHVKNLELMKGQKVFSSTLLSRKL